MRSKLLCVVLAVAILCCLTACGEPQEDYISGTSFEPIIEIPEGEYERYENKLHGIIIEYPQGYERIGNFDIDGKITFEKGNTIISVYVPDAENKEIFTVDEYVKTILGFGGNEESGIIKYGKSTGYKMAIRQAGRYDISFIVKGVDAFYRFGYSCPEAEFAENEDEFQNVMASIRVDDGLYNKLVSMHSRYKVLLEYATSMQYITDANYVSHCLNNFEMAKDEASRSEAKATVATIRGKLQEIINYERKENDTNEDLWQKVETSAKEILSVCDEIDKAIDAGDVQEAQRLARTAIGYDLSEHSSSYISVLSAEISEY